MSSVRQLYPPPNLIAIDVDGTLVDKHGNLNTALVEWIRQRKADGHELALWSMQGRRHAQTTAEAFGIADLFEMILAKPGMIVDDQGWHWIKYTKVVKSLSEPVDKPLC